MTFNQKLISAISNKNSNVCVGLDSRYDRIPAFFHGESIAASIFNFNKAIIDVTAHLAASYKMNLAFYAGFGNEGLEGLRLTNQYLQQSHPEIPRLADCKRSEMGESVLMVKQEIFDWLGFDCVFVTPWFGYDTVKEYLDDETQGVCVYVHDSNPTAAEFQELELSDGRQVYEAVAQQIVDHWNVNGNIFVEAGATYPVALKKVREIVGPEMVILSAGVGVQGGTTTDLKGVFGTDGLRLIVNSSRGIIFAGEGEATKESYVTKVAQAAEALKVALQTAR